MTQFKTLLVLIFALFANTLFAQIEKGNYSLNGGFGLSSSSLNQTNYRNQSKGASFYPSVGKLLTKKWRLTLSPSLSAYSSEGTYTSPFNNQKSISKSGNSGLGLGLSNRFYFADTKKTHYFVDADLYIGQNKYNYAYNSNNPRDTSYSEKTTAISYKLGIGADVFLNPEVALETSLIVYGRLFYQVNDENKAYSNSFSLNVGLNNFINLGQQKEENEPIKYLKKGRKIIGGRFNLDSYKYNSTKINVLNLGFSPQMGYFITDKILFRAQLVFDRTFSLDKTRDNYQNLTTAFSARYYLPVNKRFSVYPEFKSAYSISGSKSSDLSDWVDLGFGFGGSYFLSKNVALDGKFIGFDLHSRERFKTDYTITTIGINSVGLLYFIH
jgi:hypothetical protein